MAVPTHTEITLEDGRRVKALAPVVLSASRSTDIPAFYADWFMDRLKKGYLTWKNPFNGVDSYVALGNVRFIVFWSKNPYPLLDHFDKLDSLGINYYLQYTLNDYEAEGFEKGLPPLSRRIATFRDIAARIGSDHIIWRFDPLLLTRDLGPQELLGRMLRIGGELQDSTRRLIFSFADIAPYARVRNNLTRLKIPYVEWDEATMRDFARELDATFRAQGLPFEIMTCAEKIALEEFHIGHSHCVDEELIIRLSHGDPVVLESLGFKAVKRQFSIFGPDPVPDGAIEISDELYAVAKGRIHDQGQREHCGCAKSKDIGQYNTCPHQCVYCYANSSHEAALRNYQQHRLNPKAPGITGEIRYSPV